MLLVRRRAGDAFGDSYTFPGGVLDPDEAEAQPMCSGLTAAAANALLGVESGALDYYSAVVRELLEEPGDAAPVDLAREAAGWRPKDWLLPSPRDR